MPRTSSSSSLPFQSLTSTITDGNTINTNCGYCNEDPLIYALNSMRTININNSNTASIVKQQQQQQQRHENNNEMKSSSPYYLCTVTCCESENCCLTINNDDLSMTNSLLNGNNNNDRKCIDKKKKHSTSSNQSATLIMDNNQHYQTDDSIDFCELCRSSSIILSNNNNKQQQTKNQRILWADTFQQQQQPEESNLIFKYGAETTTTTTTKIVKDINYKKLKLKSLSNNNNNNNNGHTDINNNIPLSPEISSSSPFGNNSSNTEYTEICNTPDINHHHHNHNHSNNNNKTNNSSSSIIQPLFKPNQLNHPIQLTQLDYRLYFINDAEKHGFFRKAVPTLPLAIAVMFCMLNLLLPGSGTFLASFAIVFGSQTEYGPGYGYQAFLICFLSSLLQFITAILVFGWVWSIMWGIVFIKNSLRYGQKRDIHTISLC
nr:probable WRKY transcription factor protein 1 [Dermatophagoides farinae]